VGLFVTSQRVLGAVPFGYPQPPNSPRREVGSPIFPGFQVPRLANIVYLREGSCIKRVTFELGGNAGTI